MGQKTIIIVGLLLSIHSLAQSDDKKDKEAKAAIELAKAKESNRDKEAFKELNVAKSVAKFANKSLVVRYGDFPCLGVCGKLNEVVLCHLTDKDTDGKSKLRIMVYNPKDDSWYYDDFDKSPTIEEVRGRIEGLKKRLGIAVETSIPKNVDWML